MLVDLSKKFWSVISKKRQRQIAGILLLMVISSILEIVSLSSVIPFLGLMSDPDAAYHSEFILPIVQYFNIQSPEHLLFPITIFFIVAVILSALTRLLLLYVIAKVSFGIGTDVGVEGYFRILHQDYLNHMDRCSSATIDIIAKKTDDVSKNFLIPLLTLVSSIVIAIGVVSVLLFVDHITTLVALFCFGFFYIVITLVTYRGIRVNSKNIAYNSTQMIKVLQEGMGGIRDIIISGKYKYYLDLYYEVDQSYRNSSANNQFISGSPRYLIEAIGVTLIAVLAYQLTQSDAGIGSMITTLGVLALGANRLLPIFQQIYSSITRIKGVENSLAQVLDLLNVESFNSIAVSAPALGELEFNHNITLSNVGFRYSSSSHWILKDVNLTISKGDKVGFVGSSGSGKSTLLDIIMGLLTPTKGEITIDGLTVDKSNLLQWRSKITHTSQNTFISNRTIRENIAFAIDMDDINDDVVINVAKKACLHDIIKSLPDGYDTMTGDLGVKFSGGQIQRIGMARALYNYKDVIVLDESTSALDHATENKILDVFYGLSGATLLVISHRHETLSRCDYIVEVADGKLSVHKTRRGNV